MFKALLLKQEENKKATATVEDIDVSNLPEGDVLVKINYSTINYKDSLAITSSSPIVKSFPMVPGIDFSGEIEETSNENFTIGDKVILNGFGVGSRKCRLEKTGNRLHFHGFLRQNTGTIMCSMV